MLGRIGKKFKDLKLTEINMSLNELDDLVIARYPSLYLFYSTGQKKVYPHQMEYTYLEQFLYMNLKRFSKRAEDRKTDL